MIRRVFRTNAKPEKITYARRMRKSPTPAEDILWEMLKGKNLGVKFRRQHIILGWIVDFYCPDVGLVIEVDGGYHKQRQLEDAERTQKINELGIKVIRFSNEMIIDNLGRVYYLILKQIELLKNIKR